MPSILNLHPFTVISKRVKNAQEGRNTQTNKKAKKNVHSMGGSLLGIFMVNVMFSSLEMGRLLSYVTKKTPQK